MATNSPTNTNDDSSWEIVESQIRECYGRIVYSHKVHEKNADIYIGRLKTINNLEIVLSAITTGGVFGILFTDGSKALTIITAVVASVQLGITLYIKEYDLSENAERHSSTANKLWNVRESYLSLITDIVARSIGLELVQQKRDNLQQQVSTIYEKAPRTIRKAYKMAQKALKFNEELTFSDDEINLLLPKQLRRTTK
jgi:hypothetical protein